MNIREYQLMHEAIATVAPNLEAGFRQIMGDQLNNTIENGQPNMGILQLEMMARSAAYRSMIHGACTFYVNNLPEGKIGILDYEKMMENPLIKDLTAEMTEFNKLFEQAPAQEKKYESKIILPTGVRLH